MYRSLAEAAANCTRNIATGMGPVLLDQPEISRRVSARMKVVEAEAPACRLEFELCETEAKVRDLIQALSDDDCKVRVSAACALAEFGPDAKSAVPAVIDALEDRDWIVRVAAVTTLGAMGSVAAVAVPALIECLEKDDVCASSAIALGRIGGDAADAIPALLALKNKDNAFVTWCADEAIRAINAA